MGALPENHDKALPQQHTIKLYNSEQTPTSQSNFAQGHANTHTGSKKEEILIVSVGYPSGIFSFECPQQRRALNQRSKEDKFYKSFCTCPSPPPQSDRNSRRKKRKNRTPWLESPTIKFATRLFLMQPRYTTTDKPIIHTIVTVDSSP